MVAPVPIASLPVPPTPAAEPAAATTPSGGFEQVLARTSRSTPAQPSETAAASSPGSVGGKPTSLGENQVVASLDESNADSSSTVGIALSAIAGSPGSATELDQLLDASLAGNGQRQDADTVPADSTENEEASVEPTADLVGDVLALSTAALYGVQQLETGTEPLKASADVSATDLLADPLRGAVGESASSRRTGAGKLAPSKPGVPLAAQSPPTPATATTAQAAVPAFPLAEGQAPNSATENSSTTSAAEDVVHGSAHASTINGDPATAVASISPSISGPNGSGETPIATRTTEEASPAPSQTRRPESSGSDSRATSSSNADQQPDLNAKAPATSGNVATKDSVGTPRATTSLRRESPTDITEPGASPAAAPAALVESRQAAETTPTPNQPGREAGEQQSAAPTAVGDSKTATAAVVKNEAAIPPSLAASRASARGPESSSAGAATGAGTTPLQSTIDRARFVQRVARAMQHAAERDGPLRLRLHPPELGALRIEIQVRDGGLTAHLQAETPAAQAALLDGLPALRERLADQNLRLDRFDVDLHQQSSSGGQPRQSTDQQAGLPHPSAVSTGRNQRRPANDDQAVSPPAQKPLRSGSNELNVIV